jgi:hypothetical protein
VLGIEHQKVEFCEREELRGPGSRPGEKAAEEGLALKDPIAKVRSFQLSVLSLQFPNQRRRHFLDLGDLTCKAIVGLLR